MQLIFVSWSFPFVWWGNMLLYFLAWYTSSELFSFWNLYWCFYIFLIFSESGLNLYIIRVVIEFYVNLFKILILQNKSGNHSLSISSLFDQGLLVHDTEHEKLESQFCKSHFTGFLGGLFLDILYKVKHHPK